MPDSWWHALAVGAGLLGFLNLEKLRQRRSPDAMQLLLSFLGGYLAVRYGQSLWHDSGEHSRVVVVALVFCPASLVLGMLIWNTAGVYWWTLLRIVVFVVLSIAGSVLGTTRLELELLPAIRWGLLAGCLAFLPWYSFGCWYRQYRARRKRRRERQRSEEKRQEKLAQQQQQAEQQTELLQALITELRK